MTRQWHNTDSASFIQEMINKPLQSTASVALCIYLHIFKFDTVVSDTAAWIWLNNMISVNKMQRVILLIAFLLGPLALYTLIDLLKF